MRVLLGLGMLLAACGGDDEGSGGGEPAGGSGGEAASGAGGMASCGPDPSNPDEEVAPSGGDPLAGAFTLVDALAGLPEGDGPLRAVITTSFGDITCTLDERVAGGVANFVGLARGVRPWREPGTGRWVKRRYYDGLLFHRIIDDFMAQGGDPMGTGTGGPGYQIPDEIFPDLLFAPGTLAYANSGPNTNGSQFFVTEVTTDWLDGDFTVLGRCEPMAVIEMLTAVPTDGPPSDRPLSDTPMQRIDVTRCPL